MKPMATIVISAALLVSLDVQAQERSTQQAGSPAGSEPETRRISEIMTLQQMRHIKLWFAGRAGNWPLADYEIDALEQGFDDVDQQLGGDIVEKAVRAPVSAIEKAIEAKDFDAFAGAYDKLTAGCNSCHSVLDHAFVVIQRPSLLPYSDQSFAVPK